MVKTSKLFALRPSPYKGSKSRVNLERFVFSTVCIRRCVHGRVHTTSKRMRSRHATFIVVVVWRPQILDPLYLMNTFIFLVICILNLAHIPWGNSRVALQFAVRTSTPSHGTILNSVDPEILGYPAVDPIAILAG